jgi:hypothetical protein
MATEHIGEKLYIALMKTLRHGVSCHEHEAPPYLKSSVLINFNLHLRECLDETF